MRGGLETAGLESGLGSVNWGLGTGLRGWDPVCFRGHRETWEFQGWDLDCFRGNGGLRELRGWDPDCFRGYGELGELRGWDPDCFRGHRELWEFQGWDPDCFSGNGGLRGQAEACSGEDEVEGGPLLEGLEVLE